MSDSNRRSMSIDLPPGTVQKVDKLIAYFSEFIHLPIPSEVVPLSFDYMVYLCINYTYNDFFENFCSLEGGEE